MITMSCVYKTLLILFHSTFLPHMIKREIFKFFNIKEKIIPGNVAEDLFIEKMDGWTEEKGVFAFYLIDNYKSSYSLDFKQKILSYLSMVLLNPDVVSQSSFVQEAGPLVLMKRILDECAPSYQRVYDCLKDLAEHGDEESAMKILIPLVYQCSKEASKLNLLENFGKYLNTVMMLITIEKVQVWFCDEFVWSLCDSQLFDGNDYYRGFVYETNCPCFLDGFVEVSIHERSDILHRQSYSYKMITQKMIGQFEGIKYFYSTFLRG